MNEINEVDIYEVLGDNLRLRQESKGLREQIVQQQEQIGGLLRKVEMLEERLRQNPQGRQEEVRRQLPERFTIRTGWVAKGIRIIPATPRKLETTVLVKDSFMARGKAEPHADLSSNMAATSARTSSRAWP